MIKHWIEGPLRPVVDAANVSVGMGILVRIRVAVYRQHYEDFLAFHCAQGGALRAMGMRTPWLI